MRFSILLFLFLFIRQTNSKAPCDSSWLHIAHLDSCFLSAPQPAEFDEAEEFCKSQDASLVAINTEEEASIVREFFARENPRFFNWIGMRWDAKSQMYAWIDGINRNYTYFLPDEPLLPEECIAWVLDDRFDGWQAISCHYSQFFMCQKPAEGVITEWHLEEEGVITSPNWPNLYGNQEYNSHIIKSENGTRILLFFEFINTEQNCDFITVTDNYGISGRTMLRLSGSHFNYSVVSPRNYVSINFKSDEENVGKGFLLNYRIIRPLPLKVFSNNYGVITSNNYPHSPDSFLIQHYHIQCNPEHHVVLNLKAMNLDRNDKVKILNGPNENSAKLKIYRRFSSLFSEPIKSTQNSIFIVYDTGEQHSNSNNWAFEYSCVSDGNLGDEIII